MKLRSNIAMEPSLETIAERGLRPQPTSVFSAIVVARPFSNNSRFDH